MEESNTELESTSKTMQGPATMLSGSLLQNTWLVGERLSYYSGSTGHSRSCCYRGADKAGTPVFIKAYDFRQNEIFGEIRELSWLLREFINEADILKQCRENQLSRPVRLLADGNTSIGGETVHYLVCEFASGGSVRDLMSLHPEELSTPYKLKLLKDTAAGLAQLHSRNIAHQDIKPSNVVIAGPKSAKISDFGSASSSELDASPHDSLPFVGEMQYAPYERLYGQGGTWAQRRVACDLFLLGNLTFTLFVGVPFTPFVISQLPEDLQPIKYSGKFTEILPDLIREQSLILPLFAEAKFPELIREQLLVLISELCNPDVSKRGHTRSRFSGAGQYGLERYISAFNCLATRSEVHKVP